MASTMFYRVFVLWLGRAGGPGTHTDHKSRADAMLQARSLKASGYGQAGRDEIQVWKITKERIQ